MDSISGAISNLGQKAGFTNSYLKRVCAARDGSIYAIAGDRALVQVRDGKVVRRLQRSEWPVAITEDEEVTADHCSTTRRIWGKLDETRADLGRQSTSVSLAVTTRLLHPTGLGESWPHSAEKRAGIRSAGRAKSLE